MITDNQILPEFTLGDITSIFDRAIFLRVRHGEVSGNEIYGDSHDLVAQFVSNNETLLIENNQFKGVGGKDVKGAQVDVTEPGSNSTVQIQNNVFTPYLGTVPSGSSHVRSLMIKNNANGPGTEASIVVDDNDFTVSQVAILVGNSNQTTITNNTFTPLAGDSSFVDIQVSNKVPTGGARPRCR